MGQNNNQANGHAHSGFPWSHVFGFILSLALTFFSVIRGTLYKPATINDLNYHYHNGCCASVVTINYVHAFKRRRREEFKFLL